MYVNLKTWHSVRYHDDVAYPVPTLNPVRNTVQVDMDQHGRLYAHQDSNTDTIATSYMRAYL